MGALRLSGARILRVQQASVHVNLLSCSISMMVFATIVSVAFLGAPHPVNGNSESMIKRASDAASAYKSENSVVEAVRLSGGIFPWRICEICLMR